MFGVEIVRKLSASQFDSEFLKGVVILPSENWQIRLFLDRCLSFLILMWGLEKEESVSYAVETFGLKTDDLLDGLSAGG